MKEAEFKAQVVSYLNKIAGRCLVLRLQSGRVRVKRGFMHLCPEGTADYLVCCPDPRWLELKGEGQRTQKERAQKQAEFAEKVTALGHKHLTATTLEQVVEFLK